MSTNAILLAEARRRVKSNFPNGADTTSVNQIPALVRAVDLLQEALAPFAKVAQAEWETAKTVGENHLVSCRIGDCVKALKLLKQMQEPNRQPENFGITA